MLTKWVDTAKAVRNFKGGGEGEGLRDTFHQNIL